MSDFKKIMIPVVALIAYSLYIGNGSAGTLSLLFSLLNLFQAFAVLFSLYTIKQAIINRHIHVDAVLVASIVSAGTAGAICLLQSAMFDMLMIYCVGYVVLFTWLVRVLQVITGIKPRFKVSPPDASEQLHYASIKDMMH